MESTKPHWGNGDHQVTLACDCVSACTILFVWEWECWGEDPQHFILDLYTRVGEKNPFKRRLKLAWNIIRNRDHYLDGLTFDRPKAAELNQFLTTALEHKE